MATRWAVSSSNWSTGSTWNNGATLGIPVAADDVFTNSFSVNIDQSFTVNSLNNNARARDIATPAMTANNAPSPYVAAASSINGASFDAWVAFNRVYTTNTGWVTPSSTTTGWLSMDFGSGSSIIIDGYTIYGRDTQTLNPRYWTLESSNDNTNWTIRHTVSGAAAIPANGNYSVASIGNTTGSRYYRINISLNGGGVNVGIPELELYQPGTAALAAGGSFIFNSGSISGSATSTTAALTAGATNLIQVTATTGSVGLTLGSAITGLGTGTTQIINHTGNCNFNLSGVRFTGGTTTSAVCINKSSSGTITIIGDLFGNVGGNGAHSLSSTLGNTVIIGSVFGAASSFGIAQSAGNLTVTGNVVGGTGTNVTGITLSGAASQFTIVGNVTGGTATSAFGISHSGTSGSVIGNVTGGSAGSANGISTVGNVTVTGNVTGGTNGTAYGISTTGPVTVTGNILGNTGQGINTSNGVTIIGSTTAGTSAAIGTPNAVTITQTGTATASTTANAIASTGTGTVNLTGNMINVSGRQAIFSQNLFISNAATSQWRLFTQGGQDKTLYSADTFPNQPTSANVRSGSLFGPANALSGSMVVPVPSDVRVNVLTDNTVGTGQSLTAADFLAAISSSADPFAQRLRNVATVDTVGSLVTGLNGGF
jgi:hypothetical protein